ncbi:MAG: hypothetical protein RRX93_04195 [Bacteroidales bacterium]
MKKNLDLLPYGLIALSFFIGAIIALKQGAILEPYWLLILVCVELFFLSFSIYSRLFRSQKEISYTSFWISFLLFLISLSGLYIETNSVELWKYVIVGLLVAWFYMWPLRYIALGELTFGLLFGCGLIFFSASLCGKFNENLIDLSIGGYRNIAILTASSLLLFAYQFTKELPNYKQYKKVQHYSLAVILVSIFPFLDSLFQKQKDNYKISYILAILYLSLTVVAVFI